MTSARSEAGRIGTSWAGFTPPTPGRAIMRWQGADTIAVLGQATQRFQGWTDFGSGTVWLIGSVLTLSGPQFPRPRQPGLLAEAESPRSQLWDPGAPGLPLLLLGMSGNCMCVQVLVQVCSQLRAGYKDALMGARRQCTGRPGSTRGCACTGHVNTWSATGAHAGVCRAQRYGASGLLGTQVGTHLRSV